QAYNRSYNGNAPINNTQGLLGGLYGSGLATGGLDQLSGFQAGGGNDADALRALAFGGMVPAQNAANGLAGFQGAGGQQANALAALANRTGQANQGLSMLGQMATQGTGPSAAEALLRQQGNQAMADNIALARSGRGAGNNATAFRQA